MIDPLMQESQEVGSHYLLVLAVQVVVLALVVFALVRWGGKLRPRFRHLAWALLFVLVGRIVLFGNPLAWYAYSKLLSDGDVGARHLDEIRLHMLSYRQDLNQSPMEYLAIGSSQTGYIYQALEKFPEQEVKLIVMAGMVPLDFVLYRKTIREFHPRTILLYLSEFDMARDPKVRASGKIKTAPVDFQVLYELQRDFHRYAPDVRIEMGIVEKVFADLLPEWKYAFVFRGLQAHFIGSTAAGHTSTDQEKISFMQNYFWFFTKFPIIYFWFHFLFSFFIIYIS